MNQRNNLFWIQNSEFCQKVSLYTWLKTLQYQSETFLKSESEIFLSLDLRWNGFISCFYSWLLFLLVRKVDLVLHFNLFQKKFHFRRSKKQKQKEWYSQLDLELQPHPEDHRGLEDPEIQEIKTEIIFKKMKTQTRQIQSSAASLSHTPWYFIYSECCFSWLTPQFIWKIQMFKVKPEHTCVFIGN